MLRIATKEEALTFDKVLLVPAHSTVLPNSTDLSTQLTKKAICCRNISMLSAAIDTDTIARLLAIAMAQEGVMIFIHKNKSIEKQVAEVSCVNVKKHVSGIVINLPMVMVTTTLYELQVLTLTKNKGVASYYYPAVVLEEKELFRILTDRNVRFVTDLSQQRVNVYYVTSKYESSKEQLFTPTFAREGESRDEAGMSAVMVSSMLAGTEEDEESTGEITFHHGRFYKYYLGMGSLGRAMSNVSSDRYFQKRYNASDKLVLEAGSSSSDALLMRTNSDCIRSAGAGSGESPRDVHYYLLKRVSKLPYKLLISLLTT